VRKAWWIAAITCSAALVLPALAQQPAGQPDANQFFTGANPRNIKTTKIDPTRAMRGSNISKAMQPTSSTQRSMTPRGFGSVFRGVTLGSWPPKLPTFFTPGTPTTPPATKVTSSVNLFNNAK
jgi:hypothetical protein